MLIYMIALVAAVAGVALTAARNLALALLGWAVYFFGLWAAYRQVVGPAWVDSWSTQSQIAYLALFAGATGACAAAVRYVAWPAICRAIPARKQTGAPSPAAPFRPAWGRSRFVPASRTAASAARRSRYTAHTK